MQSGNVCKFKCSASYTHNTIYSLVESEWERENN